MGADVILSLGGLLLIQGNLNQAALGGEFQGVAQDVQQHLVQPHAVAADILRGDIVNGHVELLVLGPDLGLGDADDAVHHLPEGDLIHVQRQLAAFDLAHIQHVVDEPQEVAAGEGDFFQAVLNLLPVVNVGGGDGGHAHNGVHGGPDVVGHVGEEFTLGLVGLDGLLPGLLQLHHLAPEQLEVLPEYQKQSRQHHGAAQEDQMQQGAAEFVDGLVQLSVGQHRYQIPLGVGELGALQMPPLAAEVEKGGVLFPGVHGGRQLPDVLLPAFPRLLEAGLDAVKVVIPEGVSAADDKGAVPADDVGVDHGILAVQGEGLSDVIGGEAGHQGGGGAPVRHAVAGGDTQKHVLLSGGDGSHGYLFIPAVHGGQEGLRVRQNGLLAVDHVELAGGGVERQGRKVPGLGVAGQLLPQVRAGGAFRRDAPHQGFHLGQAQLDGGGEVLGDLLPHAGHVGGAHGVDGLGAFLAHEEGQEGEDAHRQGEDQRQADSQEACGAVQQFFHPALSFWKDRMAATVWA